MHQYVIDCLQRTKGDWPRVAQCSGVPKRTLEKVAREESANPSVKTIQRLYDYFLQAEAG